MKEEEEESGARSAPCAVLGAKDIKLRKVLLSTFLS
jgi:hypothetical protein